MADMPRTTISPDALTGCIEDRSHNQEGELNQVPGADLFFTVAKDVFAYDGNINHTLEQTTLEDVRAQETYTVHNDSSHGEEMDGCGFAARIKDIFLDTHANITDIINELDLTEAQQEQAITFSETLGKLAVHETYLSVVGGELITSAVDAGAHLVTYSGNHVATTLSIDEEDGMTYDSSTKDKRFNLDSNHAHARAEAFDLDGEKAEILAKVLSLATVRVLSEGAITKPVIIAN